MLPLRWLLPVAGLVLATACGGGPAPTVPDLPGPADPDQAALPADGAAPLTRLVAGDVVGVRRVTAPYGAVLYEADLAAGTVAPGGLHPGVLADTGGIALYLPPSPRFALQRGTYAVDVAGTSGIGSAQVVVRSGDVEGPQVLDLAVWVTAGLAPDALAAVEPALRAAAEPALAPHALALGEIRVVAAAEEDRARFATLALRDAAGQLHAACERAVADVGQGRHAVVVLAGALVDGGGGTAAATGTVAGFAAASPGSALRGASSRACAAVALEGGAVTPRVGRTVLHETVHLLGLAGHTTEADGLGIGLFADTPECPLAGHDANADAVVDHQECAEKGGDHLMFWGDGGHVLSPEEALTLRRHALFHPARTDGRPPPRRRLPPPPPPPPPAPASRGGSPVQASARPPFCPRGHPRPALTGGSQVVAATRGRRRTSPARGPGPPGRARR